MRPVGSTHSSPLLIILSSTLFLHRTTALLPIYRPGFAINKSLAAKPSKIVAGLDPENTNIWLQAMAYAVHKKVCRYTWLI